MELKSNDATPLRPEGDRILDCKVVEMNLNDFIEQIKSEVTWKESDRNSITIYKSQVMTIVLVGLHEKAELKPHKANGLATIQVLEGRIDFMSEQQSLKMEKGQVIALKEDIKHSVLALTDSFFLLTLINDNNSAQNY
ncbi:cupin domain-containing protein [Chryseobacterium sp. CFS15]|uniref:cupin domain-containing protein n=1 Tax=Chryseobacterium sp. CFS15 TaxID=2986946 RepID=UPI0028098B84|nr:cupin domain-containing protein [Chryseobacterium sp. CFS15]MDQ8143273.1 cupin domain-containing protein [Chryseobacterium sp. CFS15]